VDNEADTPWLGLDEAGQKLGLSRDALRKRIARGKLEARRSNDGTLRVLVTSAMLAGQVQDTSGLDRDDDETVRLLVQLEAAQERAEAATKEAAEARERAARAEGEGGALQAQVADLRAERDRLSAELAEARKGWLERVLEAVRRK
jgi:chromosome segregation ATPase